MADLLAALKKIGYDRRLGPVGSFTYQTEDTNPTTLAINPPLFPSLVYVPKGGLSKEDVAHEGTHAALGGIGTVGGSILSKLFGVDASSGYLAPDEAISYLMQPRSPQTSQDMKVLEQVAAGAEGSPLYRVLVSRLARMKR